MKYVLAVVLFVLSTLPIYGHAKEKQCYLELATGYLSIDGGKIKESLTEKRIAAMPGIQMSRGVKESTSINEISLSCDVANHWGVRIASMTDARFEVTNFLQAPLNSFTEDMQILQALNNEVVRGTVTQRADVDAIGLFVSYHEKFTSRLAGSIEGGAYRVEARLTSRATLSSSNLQSITLLGPEEKKTGYVPALYIGATYQFLKHGYVGARWMPPLSGAKIEAYSIYLSASFY